MTFTDKRFGTAIVSFVLLLIVGKPALAQAPVVSITPNSIMYTYNSGGLAPAAQVAAITSACPAAFPNCNPTVQVTGSSVTYGAGATGWLTLLPLNQGTPVNFTPYLNPTALAALQPGIYAAQVNLMFGVAVDRSSATSVAVFLTVTSSTGEIIAASPTSLAFAYSLGAAIPAAQQLAVTTNDNANFSASAQTNDGAPWLLISPFTGATPGTINVSVNPMGLSQGSYSGTITIMGPGSVTQVLVSLNVGGVALSLTPASLTFNVPQNYGFGAPQYIQVTSAGPAPWQAFANSDFNWLVVDTPTGVTPGTVTIRANDSSLPQGTYMGMVTVQTSPTNASQVPVTLTVGAPATLQLAPASLGFSYTIGNTLPAAQSTNVKSLTGSAQTFSVTSSTTDGAAWLSGSASGPTPGTVSVSVSPGTLLPGNYTGVVNVTPSGAGASPQPILVSFAVLPAPTPVVLSVVSSASFAAGTLAPGEFVTLFGTALGPPVLTTPTPGTAPSTLGGTIVTFDGIPAPILYASATQTSVQVPYGIVMPQTVVQVQSHGVTSASVLVNSAPAFPAFFTAAANGKGQIAALNQDFTLNGPSNPASRGSTIVLYGTGEGKTNPPSVEGTITTSVPPYPQPFFPVIVSFSGVIGTVVYAGETPTALAGLMQINVIIPSNSPVGPAVSVLVSINGQTSPGGVTVAVQ